jgi:pre-mRNA-splicing factor ATP-dependent RNA helicase DHX15/PRP43
MVAATDNPYLAHVEQSGALDGFIPRKVSGKQVLEAMDHPTNPFTGKKYSPQYKTILEQRKALPVFKQVL